MNDFSEGLAAFVPMLETGQIVQPMNLIPKYKQERDQTKSQNRLATR